MIAHISQLIARFLHNRCRRKLNYNVDDLPKLPRSVALTFEASSCPTERLLSALNTLAQFGCSSVALVCSCNPCDQECQNLLSKLEKIVSSSVDSCDSIYMSLSSSDIALLTVDSHSMSISQLPCRKKCIADLWECFLAEECSESTPRYLFRASTLDSLSSSSLPSSDLSRRSNHVSLQLPQNFFDLVISFRSTPYGYTAYQIDAPPALVDQSEIQSVSVLFLSL